MTGGPSLFTFPLSLTLPLTLRQAQGPGGGDRRGTRRTQRPSTAATSAGVRPYNAYTSWSISASSGWVSAVGSAVLACRMRSTRRMNGRCFAAENFGTGISSTVWRIHRVTPMPELRAVFPINQVVSLELSTAHRYLIAFPEIIKAVFTQKISPAS